MTGNQLNNEFGMNANSARYRRTGDWYHPLVEFPGVLFDINGYVIFQTEADYRACSQIDFGQDIHIRNGITNIPTYIGFTNEELIRVNRLDNDFEGALRIQREYSTYHRNQQNVQTIKNYFNNSCAICDVTIQIRNDKYYSEAHHIKPLSEDGPDIIENMICVCPTCHVKLDLKLIQIDIDNLFNPNNHNINNEFIDYHNENVPLQ
jgi:5-methylcytosine-specific restriction protein A